MKNCITKTVLVLSLALAGIGLAFANNNEIIKLAKAPKPSVYTGNMVMQNQVPENIYKKYGAITEKALHAAEAPGAVSPHMQSFIRKQRAEDLEELNSEKDEALSQMGLPSQGTGSIYILVSTSMPKSMLREYAMQAIYTGAIIDFRGVLANKKDPLSWFLKHEILPLLALNKNARPTVTIDPQPFYAFNVHAVPTIIYTKVANNRFCAKQQVKTMEVRNYEKKKITVPYHICSPMSPKKYWEMQGAVTLKYALRKFIAHGATSAKPLLTALEQGQFPNGRSIQGIKASLYAKMQTPGGIDTILDTLKSEGYYAEDSQAFNINNPGDFTKPTMNAISKALSDSPGTQ